ncbi:hypothetical protein HNP12_000636 [Aeromonas hydrophila]|jgi:hypothetical protein|uniref:hypothetical protein n=1 Tax=Aeromonas TaxID=642 RepID=UPI001C5BC718|nr:MULTISPECIES: hypothetical protein [Aeromonas]MBW3783134.1 hypothetical protein [Aeromonas veronii]MCO4172143.1 hypothetical protein [Aeromonas veronii]MCS3766588.1 hypothetical protein [Aeromonas hydrophila]
MASSYLLGDGKKVIVDMITKIPVLIFISTLSLLPWLSEREFSSGDYFASMMLSGFSLYCIWAVLSGCFNVVMGDLGCESKRHLAQLKDMGVTLSSKQYCLYLFRTQKRNIAEGSALLLMIVCAIAEIEYGVITGIQNIYEKRNVTQTYKPEFHSCPIPPVELTMEPSPPVSCNE